MKTVFKLAIALIALTDFTANAQDKTITAAELPAAAQNFIKQHFKGQTVTYAKIDKEMFDKDYKAVLSGGVEIDFDEKGNWDEIDGHKKALPASVIPKAIADYVAKTYKGQSITQLDRKRAGFDVELINGTELEFDSNGKFIRIDD